GSSPAPTPSAATGTGPRQTRRPTAQTGGPDRARHAFDPRATTTAARNPALTARGPWRPAPARGRAAQTSKPPGAPRERQGASHVDGPSRGGCQPLGDPPTRRGRSGSPSSPAASSRNTSAQNAAPLPLCAAPRARPRAPSGKGKAPQQGP